MKNLSNLLTKFRDPRTKWKYVLIVVILGFLVGGGIFVYTRGFIKEIISLSKFPEIKKPEKVGKDEIANWKVYRNEEYGFEIKYPEDWYVEAEINPTLRTKLSVSFCNYPPGEGVEKEDYQLIVFAIEEGSITQWLEKGKETGAKIEEFIVDSQKGYKASLPKVGISSVFAKNKYLYSLMITFPTTEGKKTFDKMLSTLRFLEK